MAASEWGGGRRAQGRGAGRRQSKTHRFPDVWSSKHGAAVEFEKGEELKRRKKKKKRERERERESMKLGSEKRGQGKAKGIHHTEKCLGGNGEQTGSNNNPPSPPPASPLRISLIQASTALPGVAPLPTRP